ncbi:Solute carrier family 35 member F4 [Chelonia mydas]|uniref:Solute carrier family 35 member F4 n=1 Tax=Chelonia mydas TaxID=8469 RepID=M7B7V2_CHEMY|nr:Solute carrier family 35 member F4 [Chelonia mydas]
MWLARKHFSTLTGSEIIKQMPSSDRKNSCPGFRRLSLASVSIQPSRTSSINGVSRSSVTRCKPGANCPSTRSGISRQLSPLSVAEDSAAPILELQSRSPSGICRHSRVERQIRSDHGCSEEEEEKEQEVERYLGKTINPSSDHQSAAEEGIRAYCRM